MVTLPFQKAKKLDHKNIVHGFFGRQGGVSQGIYTSLNTGFHKDDDDTNIIENRQRICSVMGISHMVTLRQVHKSDVLIVDQNTINGHQSDAMVSKTPGRLLAIQTADCAPILLTDPFEGIIGAIHAGWRSAVAGIVEKTIDAMQSLGAKKENITAAIGPCIHQKSYEVGQEVFDAAKQEKFFISSVRLGYYLFDLAGYVLHKLETQGIKNTEALSLDTYALEDEYFSCRRSAHRGESFYGNQLSTIGLL
jgi:YfiH family protein